MPELILILISFAFGILCIRHLRRYDVHEQEPLWVMVAVTIWGGFVSIVSSLFLYRMIQENGIALTDGFPFSYLYVGYVEELAKLLALVSCWPIIRKEMDEPTDGLIYMACVALGFSLIENYFYALANPGINALIAIRLVICTPMHIASSACSWDSPFSGRSGAAADGASCSGCMPAPESTTRCTTSS